MRGMERHDDREIGRWRHVAFDDGDGTIQMAVDANTPDERHLDGWIGARHRFALACETADPTDLTVAADGSPIPVDPDPADRLCGMAAARAARLLEDDADRIIRITDTANGMRFGNADDVHRLLGGVQPMPILRLRIHAAERVDQGAFPHAAADGV